jgi:hypothetical protein
MTVCLDPDGVSTAGCTSVMFHFATALEREIVYVTGPLTVGPHTIQVSHGSGSPIALDGLVVLS